jgi:hypothetical protein
MRRVKNECLRKMKSPIKWIFLHLHEAIVNIAPSKQEEFDSIYPTFTLEYLDVPLFKANANSKTKHIKISRGVMELVWAVAYAHTLSYTRWVVGHKFTEEVVIDPNSDPEVGRGLSLLHWAISNDLNPAKAKRWPKNLPKPLEKFEHASWEHYAQEMSLVAGAFILHHELVHIRRGHIASSGAWSIEQENETDYEAVDWIVGPNPDIRSALFIKQMLGITCALEVLLIRKIYSPKSGGNTHPHAWNRIFNVIRRFIQDNDHPIFAFATMTIKLHLDNANIAVTSKVYEDFFESFDAYIDVLSKRDLFSSPIWKP